MCCHTGKNGVVQILTAGIQIILAHDFAENRNISKYSFYLLSRINVLKVKVVRHYTTAINKDFTLRNKSGGTWVWVICFLFAFIMFYLT